MVVCSCDAGDGDLRCVPRTPQLPMTTQSSASEAPVDVATLNSKEAVREMVSRLSDDSVRQLLIERLDAVATESEG